MAAQNEPVRMESKVLINLETHQVFPLTRGYSGPPRRGGGNLIHPSTLYRWKKNGVEADDGTQVYLETLRVGRTTCTSVEAIQRFCERLTGDPAASPIQRTITQRRSGDELAARECDRLGL